MYFRNQSGIQRILNWIFRFENEVWNTSTIFPFGDISSNWNVLRIYYPPFSSLVCYRFKMMIICKVSNSHLFGTSWKFISSFALLVCQQFLGPKNDDKNVTLFRLMTHGLMHLSNLEKRWKQQVNFWCYKLLFSGDWSTMFENYSKMSHFHFLDTVYWLINAHLLIDAQFLINAQLSINSQFLINTQFLDK